MPEPMPLPARTALRVSSSPSSPGRDAGGRRRICVQPIGRSGIFVLALRPGAVPSAPTPSIFIGEEDMVGLLGMWRVAGKSNDMSENGLSFDRKSVKPQSSSFF